MIIVYILTAIIFLLGIALLFEKETLAQAIGYGFLFYALAFVVVFGWIGYGLFYTNEKQLIILDMLNLFHLTI
jgi:hypothetical protein